MFNRKWKIQVLFTFVLLAGQARHCYTRYNEYHRCVAQKGEEDPECSVFQRAYRSICPGEWLERCVSIVSLQLTRNE